MALILLITIAVLAGIDVVMYLVLSVVDRHWEKRFENEEDNDDNEKAACVLIFAEYLKETEPAPAATGTSSTKKENTFQIDDSTKEQICQAYKTADEACSNILTVYEGMSECEQRAFDIGEAYGKIFSTRDKLENMRGAN